MSKSFICGFIVGVALLVAGAGVSGSQDKQAMVDEEKERQYRTEIVDATPVQLRMLTPKQQFHSRLHNGAGMMVGGKTISESMAFYKGQRIVIRMDILGGRFLPSDQPEIPEDY